MFSSSCGTKQVIFSRCQDQSRGWGIERQVKKCPGEGWGTVTARIEPRIRINAISYNFSFVCAHSCIAMMFSETK